MSTSLTVSMTSWRPLDLTTSASLTASATSNADYGIFSNSCRKQEDGQEI